MERETSSRPLPTMLVPKRDRRERLSIKNFRWFAFRHLQQRACHQEAGQPVLSVDTKKKELVGDFKNAGQIWCQEADTVNVHDIPSQALGRAVPYGIYDLTHNLGSVYVGQSADTPAFAVDNLGMTVRWQFTTEQARIKLRKLYPKLLP